MKLDTELLRKHSLIDYSVFLLKVKNANQSKDDEFFGAKSMFYDAFMEKYF